MSGEDEQSDITTPQSSRGYTFVSALTEETALTETYGVQFCLKPSKYHLEGGGRAWPQQCPPADTSQGGEKLNTTRAKSSQMENTIADDDCEILPANAADQHSVWRDIFVTCAGTAVRVYEARKKKKPMLLQVYHDEDFTEIFYCVAITYNADDNHQWWICVAGKKGVVRVINMQQGSVIKSLTGHGEAINDLKIHPRDSALVLSASKDESLRLWNLRTGVTVAMFAGLKGHRGEVLFVDFDATGRRFASCGIDNSIRIWDVDADIKLVDTIVKSHEAADAGAEDGYTYADKKGKKQSWQMRTCQFPYFVTTKVHEHYVDCVMWVGDLLLSKSIHNRILLWEPGFDREAIGSPIKNYTLLEEYTLEGCKVWFIRFGMDRRRQLIACGNDKVSEKRFQSEGLLVQCAFSGNKYSNIFCDWLYRRN